MLHPKEPTTLLQTKFSYNCKQHKQPFTLICLHTSCHSCYKLLCLKCKKQKHYQHPNRVLSLSDFYLMLSANRMQFIENSLGISLVGIKNKLTYVSNFRIYILEKQAMLIENAKMIHDVVCRICEEKKMLKGWIESVNCERREEQQQQSQQVKDPQSINQSLQLIKKHITYNPIQSTIRITSQPVNTLKIQLQKLSQSTKSLIDDIRQYLMKIIQITIQEEVDDQDIEYIEHEDVDEKVFNIDVKKKNDIQINEGELRYKVEQLQGMFQGLLKGEMEKHEEHVQSEVVKLEEEIKIKQEIIQNIRKRSSSKTTTTAVVQDYPEEDSFGEDLMAYAKKDPFEEIIQVKGINTLPAMDTKFTYISLKGNDNSANKLLKNNLTNSSITNNNSNNPNLSNSNNKKAQKNVQQSIKGLQLKPPAPNNNTRFIRNNKRVQNNNINSNSKLQQQNQIRSLRYNNKKKCSLFYGESTDENGLKELLNIQQTSFNTSREDLSKYIKKQDRQQDNSKLDSQSMLLEEEVEDERGKIMKIRQDEKGENSMIGRRVNELEKEVERLNQQVRRLKQQNFLSLEELIKTRQQSQQERGQLLQKIRQYQSQQQDQLMKQINKELGWSLQINKKGNNQEQEKEDLTQKLIEEKEELERRLGELEDEIKGFVQREIIINNELAKVKQESINKQQQIQNLKQQHIALQSQNNHLHQGIVNQQKQQQIEIQNIKREQKSKLEKMFKEKQHLNQQLRKLQDQLKELSTTALRNIQQLEENNQKIRQMQKVIDNQRQQLNNQQQQLNNQRQQLNNQRQQLNKFIMERNQQRQNNNSKLQQLNQQHKQKDCQLQQLVHKLSTLQQQILIINASAQQSSTINNQLSHLTSQIQQQQQYIQLLTKQQLKQKQLLTNEYKRELQFRQKDINQQLDKTIELCNQKMCESINQKIILEAKLKEIRLMLQEKSEQLERTIERYSLLQSQRDQLRHSNSQLYYQLQQLQPTLLCKDNRIIQLTTLINTLNQQLNLIKSQYESLQQQLQQTHQSQQQQTISSNSQILQLKKTILKSFEENNRLTQKSQYYEKKAKQYEVKITELQKENVILGEKLYVIESNKSLTSPKQNNNTLDNINNQHLILSKHNEIRQLIQFITTDMHLLEEKVKQNTIIEKVYLKELDRKRTENRKLKQEIQDSKGSDGRGIEENNIMTNNDKIVDNNGLAVNRRGQSIKRRITVKQYNTTTNTVQTKLIINPSSTCK